MLFRYFNSIDINYESGTLTKSSVYRDKLRYEVKFYEDVSGILAEMLPELITYSSDYSSYTVRHISGKDVGELYALDKCSVRQLTSIFKTVEVILSDFDPSLGNVTPEFLHKVFIGKALDRAKKLNKGQLKDIFFSDTTLNGKSYPPLNELLINASLAISRLDTRQIVLHGDMCFSNLIIEDNTEKLFFVDPRGGFESPSIYGPAIYDVAKLAQSVVGLYDSITNDQYSLSGDSSDYILAVNRPMFYKIAEKKFMDSVSEFNLDGNAIHILAGVMLAGAPIFHIDDENRAIAIALRCLELLGG